MCPRAEGVESQVVHRLTERIADPALHDILVRCLGGELPSAEALLAMLEASGDPAAVRAAVDEVTRRADEDSRTEDHMVRDRVDDLTQLVVDIDDGTDRVTDHAQRVASGLDDAPVAYDGPDPSMFTTAELSSAPAGEALWLLPDDAQERALAALLDALAAWGVLTPGTRVLELGCGSGRILAALGARVREAHGIEHDTALSAAARRRTALLPNVLVADTEAQEGIGDAHAEGFDLVLAVDYFPTLPTDAERERMLGQAVRALRARGRLAVVNFSSAPDAYTDAAHLEATAGRAGLRPERLGERPVPEWRATVHVMARV